MAATIVGAGDTSMNKADKNACSYGPYILEKRQYITGNYFTEAK